MLQFQRLIRAVTACPVDRWAFVAEDLSPRDNPRRDHLDSFFMTSHPTRFEKTSHQIQKEPKKAWNWFHTLTERKPAVKSESRKTNGLDWFSNFLAQARGSRDHAENTIAVLV